MLQLFKMGYLKEIMRDKTNGLKLYVINYIYLNKNKLNRLWDQAVLNDILKG